MRCRGSARPLLAVVLAAMGACEKAAETSSLAVEAVLPESAYLALREIALEDDGPACTRDAEWCAEVIHSAVTHSDGSVAFWGRDGKRPQLYRIDPAGRPVAVGRVGSGPGEYRFQVPVGFASNGELLVADLHQRRLMRFAADTRLLSTDAIPIPLGLFNVAVHDGQLFAFATEVPRAKGDSMPVSVHALEPGARETRRVRELPIRRPGFAATDLRPVPASFAPEDQYAFDASGGLLNTASAAFVIDRFDEDGGHALRFGFEVTAQAVSDAELDISRDRALRGVNEPRMREALEQSLRTAGTQARHPAITRMIAARDGTIWVRESPREAGDSVSWVVFSAPAKPLGRIILGAGDVVMDAREGRVLLAREGDATASSGLRWSRTRRR